MDVTFFGRSAASVRGSGLGGGFGFGARHPSDGEVAAGNALHVVTTDVKVSNGIEASEFYGCYIIGFSCFFLSAYDKNVKSLLNLKTYLIRWGVFEIYFQKD